MSKPIWQEDDATLHDPDHETIDAACLRITGLTREDFVSRGNKVDLGDANSYALDGWLIVLGYPGANEIYKSRTR